VKTPDTKSQNDSTTGLKRLGGEAAEGSDKIPADIGSTATAKINSEQSQLEPDPVGMAGGFKGGRQFQG
jgi:hypothetical protein